MLNRPRIFALLAVLAVVALAAAYYISYSADPYRRQMRPVYAVIKAGEQGWGVEANRLLDAIVAKSTNRQALAERLMKEPDASLVAEGMILAVRYEHPQARRFLELRLNDSRWNWSLSQVREVAKQLLLYLDGKPIESWVSDWLQRYPAK